ncbi:MAG: hypothetical protein ISS87_02360 [Candidatus Pacebacteria bacterium]|nr:hypothetical protein [Candidatus Paceibacterota bacterium]
MGEYLEEQDKEQGKNGWISLNITIFFWIVVVLVLGLAKIIGLEFGAEIDQDQWFLWNAVLIFINFGSYGIARGYVKSKQEREPGSIMSVMRTLMLIHFLFLLFTQPVGPIVAQ